MPGMPVAPWCFSYLLVLLLCGSAPPAAAYEDHGLIIFWNANGIHEVDMNASLPAGSPPRTILAQPRGDDAAQLWPPVIGGLCVDPLSQVVVYTTNSHVGGTLRRAILLVELDGSSATPLTVAELPTAAGDLVYGCSINSATRTISFVEFNKAEHRQRVSSVTFAGAKDARTFGAPTKGIGMRVQETHPQGGGLTQLADGTLFVTAAEKAASAAPSVPGLYKLGSTKFTYVASCATKGDWRGHLGYPVAQSDGSFIIADADDSTVPSASRDTTVLLVPADQATPISNAARSGVPLSPHVGDDALAGETNIALSPTVASTSASGSVLFLQGSPPSKIYSAEGLTGAKARPKFKAAYSELDAAGLGEYGIGPMVWTERSDLTLAPETPAPDTTAPTPAPAGVTAAPVAANVTEAPANGTAAPGVNDTTSEPAAGVATATLVDMATAAPAVTDSPADVNYTAAPPVGEAECRSKTNRDDCVTRKGCGFVTQDELDGLASLGAPVPAGIGGGGGAQVGVKGQCTLFGSLCGEQGSKAQCKTLHYCFWRGADSPANVDGGAGNSCEVSADCGEKLLRSTCTAPEWGGQCAWDTDTRRCEPVEAEEDPSTEKTETLLLVYLAAIGAAICCLLVFCFAFWRAKKVGDKFDGRRKKTVWYKAVQEDEVQLTGELADDEGGVHDPDGAISLQESQQRARRDDVEKEMDDWREKHLFDVQEVVPIGRGQMAATPTGSEEGSDGDLSDGFDADAAAAATSWGLDGGGGGCGASPPRGGGLDADLLGNESAPLARTEAEVELLRAIQKKKSEVEKGERLARGEARRGSRGPGVDADAQSAAALTVASARFGQQRRGGASFRAGAAGARGSGASDSKSGGRGALGPTDSSGGLNSSTTSHPSPPVPPALPASASSPSAQRRSVANGRRSGPGSPVSPNPARASSSDLAVADWAKDLPKGPPGGGGSSSSPGSMRRRGGEHKSPLLPRSGGGGGGDDQYSPAVKHQSIRICDGLYPTLEEGMKELSPTSPSIKLTSSKGSPKKAVVDDEGV